MRAALFSMHCCKGHRRSKKADCAGDKVTVTVGAGVLCRLSTTRCVRNCTHTPHEKLDVESADSSGTMTEWIKA